MTFEQIRFLRVMARMDRAGFEQVMPNAGFEHLPPPFH